MRNKIITVVFMMLLALPAFSQTPTAAELLARVDDNEVYKTIEYEGELIIENRNRRYVKNFRAWARDNSDSFIEFVNSEDRGTKYLKQDGRVFMYSPDIEGIVPISGHLLKESMMGSDMTYEDTVDNATLSSRYNPFMTGAETWNGRQAWVLELTAKNRAESYPARKFWIDQENGDLLHYELFALSGVKIKEYNLVRVEEINGRRFPVEGEIRGRESKTTFIMKNVVLDKPIPNSVFSQRNLRP